MTIDRRWARRLFAAGRRRGGLPAALAAMALMLAAAPAAAEEPTILTQTRPINAPPGLALGIHADEVFHNPGTDPEITEAEFSTTLWYSTHEVSDGRLLLQARTEEELNALASPPPSPFEVTVDVTMENAEGQTASGALTFQTTYERTSSTPWEPPPEPTFSHSGTISAAPGAVTTVLIDDLFDNPGTNPRFVGVGFHSTTYLEFYDIPEATPDRFTVEIMNERDLSALSPQPPRPFSFQADVSMENDEGQTASGTVTFSTTWTPIAVSHGPLQGG